MEQFNYNEISYRCINGYWVDTDGIVLPDAMQRKINFRFEQYLVVSSLSAEEAIKLGDEVRNSSSFNLAVKYYEHASKSAPKMTLAYILPRLTSCYRSMGFPQKAIDILTYASKKYGPDIISVPLLTSAAAAYCDMGDYVRARQCCNRAYFHSNKNPSNELRMVYKRIESEENK